MMSNSPTLPEIEHHVKMLHRLGLYAVPGWDGGKLLPGTNQRELSLQPPSLEQILAADYSDGLIILAGTENPFGGFVVAIDVDNGPEYWPQMPKGFLYDELGTQNHKRHIFVRTTDRLEGCLNLVVRGTGELVTEIKGLNLSLRSWPTIPPGKPRGYMPMSWPIDPALDPPTMTGRQLAEGMADLLSHTLGESVWIKDFDRGTVRGNDHRIVPDSLALKVEAELERRKCKLKNPGASGWQSGFCPFHDNTNTRAFSVNLSMGWKCFSTCGSGSIFNLAHKLGLIGSRNRSPRKRNKPSQHKPVPVEFEVTF